MKKIILCLLLAITTGVYAKETIHIISPYSPSHSGTAAMFKIVNTANNLQTKYKFILDFKPGAEQLLAVLQLNQSPNNHLSIIAPKYVEHVRSGKLKKEDHIPIYALGDACWAVISNVGNSQLGTASLKGEKELVIGGVGIGSATHLTSLQLGEKFKFSVRFIPYKSNADALINMISDNSINLVIDRVLLYEQFKEKAPNLKILGMSCPIRHPERKNIRTLAEQGIESPYVFNVIIAHNSMEESKRRELGQILNQATINIGKDEMFKISDMISPIFNNINVEDYFNARFSILDQLLKKYAAELEKSSKN